MIWDYLFWILLMLFIAFIWIAIPVIVIRNASKVDLGMQMFRLGLARIIFACCSFLYAALSFLGPLGGTFLWEDSDWRDRTVGTLISLAVIVMLYAFVPGLSALAMYRRLYRGNHPEDADDPERPSVEAHIRGWRWLCRLVYRSRHPSC